MSSKARLSLTQILNLVGKLNDAGGEETSRERFREFLKLNVKEVGPVRDYIEECLRLKGDQYNRALQDLINHLGGLLGFKITFGRYQGVIGKIGFDGLWESTNGSHIIVEVKTTDAYAIKTATLLGYIDGLISEKTLPNWDNALGLYVVGRPDSELRQLENAIIAEKRVNQLRIISVESLLSLAEMMNEYDVNHEDILSIIKPSGPKVDPVVDLMARLVAQSTSDVESEEITITEPPKVTSIEPDQIVFWLTPVRSDEEETAEQVIQTLVGEEKIYAFGERTPGRKSIKPGDWICFYATGKGTIGQAKVLSKPVKKPHPKVRHSETYPWVFKVGEVELYLNDPRIIDIEIRGNLDAFQNRDPIKPWGWFVQATRKISNKDFKILTRQNND